uniref:Uncharacterized protein n=1 Tax=Malurus cyaneus samueli TaxID=2593467 RepID=A0A8C5TVI9_9PASS
MWWGKIQSFPRENTGTKSTRRTRKKTGKSPSTVIGEEKIPRKRNTKTRRKPNTKMAAQRNTKTNTKIKTRRRERKRRWVSPKMLPFCHIGH